MEEKAKKTVSLQKYTEDIERDVMAAITKKEQQGLTFPAGYNVNNAVTSAMFQIKNIVNKEKKPALSVCRPETVKQALWDMASKGLDPNKNHCYWIVYGQQLQMFESYFGLVFRAKRSDPNIQDIFAEVVYEKDTFKYQVKRGTKVVTEHLQMPENIDLNKIKGAYATILYKDGTERSEYMTMQQIRNSWSKGQTKGESDAHRLSPEQMAKRTVLNRLAKISVNTDINDVVYRDIATNADAEAEEKEATQMIDITPEEDTEEKPETEEDVIEEEPEVDEPSEKQLEFPE